MGAAGAAAIHPAGAALRTLPRLTRRSARAIRVHWTATPPIERIAIGEWQTGDPAPRTKTIDVTDRWPRFAGDTLLHYRFSLQEGVGGPEPMPDCLVVTADRDVAENYRPTRAWDNAWGSDL